MFPAQAAPTPTMVGAVVVTFEPDDASLDCIRTIIGECAHTLILDNASSEPRRAELRRLASATATVVENDGNAGVATGFNKGIQAAAALGYRWFVLFDQDSRIFSSTLPDLIRAYSQCAAELGDRLGFIACGYNQILEDGTVLACNESQVPAVGKAWFPTDLSITAGTLISLKNFEAIGPFRDDFFIDHVDHEYCLRAQRMGYIIARTAIPLMIHRLGNLRWRRPLLTLGRRKLVNYYAPLRRYYQLRNLLFLARSYEKEFPTSIAYLRASMTRENRRALKYDSHPFRVIRALCLARRHFRQGVAGKFAEANKL